ncbi:MAG: hypothetical protein M1470_02960 [Bacteroidetes bacterium]|nr:hypothetical protein [Bacteroidota bacterium]MCL5739229.1 hypothetical protein [Bacteroidota bacterium]
MIERLPFFAEDVRSLILSIEGTLQELGGTKPGTTPEALLRRRLTDFLETAESSLIDCHAILLDGTMCHDTEDLALFMSQVESGAEP